MESAQLYLSGVLIALTIAAIAFYYKFANAKALSRHYSMCKLRLSKLPPMSSTRKRLELARSLFEKGWQALKSDDPYQSLGHFARAVEIDELGCMWKQSFESKLEQIGDYFTLPPKNEQDKYESMLAEAYLVVLLYTVVSVYGKRTADLEEDYRVVKTRLDVCVALKPDNPMVYKLRADFAQRFGHLANRTELVADFRKAIELAEADTEGTSLLTLGLDPKQQRSFVIAYCGHQLGSLLHRNKDLEGAFEAYSKAAQHADADFVNMADIQFSLCILTLMRARNVQPEDKPKVLVQAVQYYKAALMAEKRALKYLPHVDTDVSRRLAKELMKKLAKQGRPA